MMGCVINSFTVISENWPGRTQILHLFQDSALCVSQKSGFPSDLPSMGALNVCGFLGPCGDSEAKRGGG